MSGKKPNVVIFHTDQQRYDSLGCTGNSYAITPNLDRMAKEGTLFHRHISANPVCMPSRASLFTGRYPNASGVYTNGVPIPRSSHVYPNAEGEKTGHQGSASHVETMADTFSENGYHTCSIGKLHFTGTHSTERLGYEESNEVWKKKEMNNWHGPYYGFDKVHLAIGHGEKVNGHYRKWLAEEYPDVLKKVQEREHVLDWPYRGFLYPSVIPEDAHSSTWIANCAEEYLLDRKDKDQPFFLFLGFPDPHFPIVPPKSLADQFSQRGFQPPQGLEGKGKPQALRQFMGENENIRNVNMYDEHFIQYAREFTNASVHLIDQAVGRICDMLRTQEIEEDTILIFTSDHGDFLGDYGLVFKYEACNQALNHVPFIMKAPGKSLPDETDQTMSNVDVFPTLCELTGIPFPKGIQGKSVLSEINGDSSHQVQVVCYPKESKFINFSIYDRRYRLTWYPRTGERELYDHHHDPYELVNLAGRSSMREKEEELYFHLLELHCQTDQPASGQTSNV